MRKILICGTLLIVFSGCPKKEEPAALTTVTPATPTSLSPANSNTGSKCDKALGAIPTYEKDDTMFEQLHDFYKEYDSCMDAGIAEGIEALTVQVLSQNWDSLSSFATLSKKDPGFKTFILRNIDSLVTGLNADVKNIVKLAKSKCPANEKELCAEIQTAAEKALQSEKDDVSSGN